MMSNPSGYGQLKSLATVGLVLRSALERFPWTDYVSHLRDHVSTTYRKELPSSEELVEIELDTLTEILIDRLGQETAVLSAYKVLEDLIERDKEAPKEEAEAPSGKVPKLRPNLPSIVPEENKSPEADVRKDVVEMESAADGDKARGEEPAAEREASDTAGADGEFPAPEDEHPDDGEPDEPADRDDRSGESDADSGYYSADGGRDAECDGEAARPDTPTDESSAPTTPSTAVRRSSGESSPDRGGCFSHSSDSELGCATETRDPFAAGLRKCIERQAMILTGALKDAQLDPPLDSMPLTVDAVQRQLERFLFNPDPKVPREHVEARYNFYPPFMTPKAIANYHIFAVTAPIPPSCKANRSGSEVLRAAENARFFKRLPRWKQGVTVDDGLGDEVSPITELKDAKLVPLRDDTSRLEWAKMRGEHVRYFCYPSLHMPPKISRMLMEVLLQPFAQEVASGGEQEDPEPVVSDAELACIVDPEGVMQPHALARAIEVRRRMVAQAVRYTAQLELMERVFREPSSIKKAQEVLHHTFHHGFVALIRETAKVNLSNYATFHGITYNDPLNNCMLAKLMEGSDKRDYVVDSIYLFLVLTWQTAMGMWQQAIQEETIEAYREAFTRLRRAIYALETPTEISKAIVDVLMDGDRLCAEMRKALPNFTNGSQISAFRQFIMERSNIPTTAAPFLPSDFVPLSFRQAQPLLWDQVYLLQTAFFLCNHGGYLWEPEETENPNPRDRTYCPCNLCSPHRMPQHNVPLHNELLAINTFEIRTDDGKTFKLTPELWANAYLDKFEPKDYHPFEVVHFPQHEEAFSRDLTACVTKSPEILSLIRQIQASREEFLLTRGKGVYKDPDTGEVLTPQPDLQAGAARRQALPTAYADHARGAATSAEPSRALRPTSVATAAGETEHGGALQRAIGSVQPSVAGATPHGPENGRPEGQGFGTSGARNLQPRGGDRVRRRNSRQRGYRYGRGPDEHDLRRGGGGGGRRGVFRGSGWGRQGEQPPSPYDSPQTQPKSILRRPVPGPDETSPAYQQHRQHDRHRQEDPSAAPTRPSTPR